MKSRSKLILYFKILSLGLVLMLFFFNCGQPGQLGLLGQQSIESADDGENTVTNIDQPGAPKVDPPKAPPPNIEINEVLNKIRPALVVRATGCIMCHSTVASSIITDFGFGGDGHGKNYFFGGIEGQVLPSELTNTQGGSVYGDYDYSQGDNVNWGNSKLSDGAKVFVPMALTAGLEVPDDEAPNVEDSLASYLKMILKKSKVQESRSVEVVEVDEMYIGAPTSDRIIEATSVDSGELKYKPTNLGEVFSGIAKSNNGKIYKNSPSVDIVCEGDLAIDGVLYLDRPKIKTKTGCRLYVTKSVFIAGPITYVDSEDLSNLQISSARMIALGVGHDCEDSGESHPDSYTNRFTNSGSDQNRYKGFFTRNLGTPNQMLASMKADADLVGNLKDASCGTNKRDVGFERLMLNAPVIHSRYKGEFKGLMISEIALLSLASLKYHFDPVFSNTNVRILPLLKNSDFLEIGN